MLPIALLLLAPAGSPPGPVPTPAPAPGSPMGDPTTPAAKDPLQGVRVSARLVAETLEPGAEARIVIELDAGEASAAGAGIPAPILQLDLPPSVELEGRVLKTYAELARNEFLQEPFERLLTELPAEIRFTLKALPAEKETIGINVIGYLKTESGDAFLRRRLELPLRAGATAKTVSPQSSTWSTDEKLLDIGDRAALFDLPRADGSRVRLEQYLGDKTVIVTTYRAHW